MVSVQFRKNFTGPPFCGGWTKKLQTFSRHFFWEQPSKYCIAEFTAIFVCLLLSWSRRYSMKWSSNFDGPQFQQYIPQFFKYDKPLPKYLIHWKFKMSAIFILKKEPPKNPKFFMFLRGRYFVMGEPIDMNADVFRKTSVGFLKCVVLQLFPK